MKFDFVLFGIGGFVVGLFGIGYTIRTRKKLDDISKKIDMTIENISEDIDVDLPGKFIKKAVNKALDREASRRVEGEINKSIVTIRQDINNEVRTAVRNQYHDISKKVNDEISSEIAKLDINNLKCQVREEAKNIVVKKFDGKLNDIIEKFNNDLGYISKFYTSIANTISGSDDSKELKIILG